MLVSDFSNRRAAARSADLTLPTEGRPATQVAAGSLENPNDRIFRGLGSRLIHEAGTVTGEARTLGVFLGSSARSARFSDRASRAPLLSGPFDLFFRLAFPSGNFIGAFLSYKTSAADSSTDVNTIPPSMKFCVSLCV